MFYAQHAGEGELLKNWRLILLKITSQKKKSSPASMRCHWRIPCMMNGVWMAICVDCTILSSHFHCSFFLSSPKNLFWLTDETSRLFIKSVAPLSRFCEEATSKAVCHRSSFKRFLCVECFCSSSRHCLSVRDWWRLSLSREAESTPLLFISSRRIVRNFLGIYASRWPFVRLLEDDTSKLQNTTMWMWIKQKNVTLQFCRISSDIKTQFPVLFLVM